METITYDAERFILTFDRIDNEFAALEAWRAYVLACGWSQVGDPTVWNARRHVGPYVVGWVFKTQHPVKVTADLRTLVLPSEPCRPDTLHSSW